MTWTQEEWETKFGQLHPEDQSKIVQLVEDFRSKGDVTCPLCGEVEPYPTFLGSHFDGRCPERRSN